MIEMDTKTRLWGSSKEIELPVKSLMFGHLVNLTDGVENYRSDLYHDALWIEKNIEGPGVFFFATRTWGTHIGTDRDLILRQLGRGDHLYRVELIHDAGEFGGDWHLAVSKLRLPWEERHAPDE